MNANGDNTMILSDIN